MVQYPTLHKIQIMYIRRTRRTKGVLKTEDASTPHYTIINSLSGLFIILTPCSFPHKQYINQTPMLYTITSVSIRAFQTFLQIIIPLSPLMRKNSLAQHVSSVYTCTRLVGDFWQWLFPSVKGQYVGRRLAAEAPLWQTCFWVSPLNRWTSQEIQMPLTTIHLYNNHGTNQKC